MGFDAKKLKRMGFDIDDGKVKLSKLGNTPCWYNGIKYRSTLEARIACMFDYWIEYGTLEAVEYEPETLRFEHTDNRGKRRDIDYIYDFFLTGYEGKNWIVEVKGMIREYDLTKWRLYTENYEEPLMIMFQGNLMPKRPHLKMGQRRDPMGRPKFIEKGKVSRTTYNRMQRIATRVWENVGQELNKYRMEIIDSVENNKPRRDLYKQ